MIHPAVHGTELVILLVAEAIILPATIVAAIAYVRIALTAGRDQS